MPGNSNQSFDDLTSRRPSINQPTKPQQGSAGISIALPLIVIGLVLIVLALGGSFLHIPIPPLSQLMLVGVGILLLLGSCVLLMFTKLYHRVPADIALVRTGMGGKKTILDGGIIVIPTVHAVIYVFCGTMKFVVVREGKNALLTQDNLRADITAEFFLRVHKNEDDVTKAAASLGEKAMIPDQILATLEEKLESALREVAVSNTLHNLNSNRQAVIESVSRHVADALPDNGLSLETMTISRLDQTPPTQLRDADNIFDAQGKRTITEITTAQQVASTQLQLDAKRKTQEMQVETQRRLYELEIARASAEATQQQQIQIAQAQAKQEAQTRAAELERLAQLALVAKDQAVQLAEVSRSQAVDIANQQREQATTAAQIEKDKSIALSQRQSAIEVAERETARAKAEAERLTAEALRMKEEQGVQTVRTTAEAERNKQIAVIAAEAEAQKSRLAQQVQADLKAYSITKEAQAELEAAQNRANARTVEAKADRDARTLSAEADRALQIVPVEVSMRQVEVRQAQVAVEATQLANQTQYADIAYRKEIDLARIQAAKEVEIARAQAMGTALSHAQMQFWSDAGALEKLTAMFGQGQSFGALLDGIISTAPHGLTETVGSMGAALSALLLEKFGVHVDAAQATEVLSALQRRNGASADGGNTTTQK